MKKEVYFKSTDHFLNFCNKYISLDYKDNINLMRLLYKAWDNESLACSLLEKLSYNLRFHSTEKIELIRKIIEVSGKIENENILELVMEYNIFENKLEKEIEFQNRKKEINFNPELAKELEKISFMCGLYFFYDENKNLIYIGKSKDLASRIITSIVERRPVFLKYKLTHSKSDTNILELYLISLFKPKLNKDSKEKDNTSIRIDYNFLFESDFIKVLGD